MVSVFPARREETVSSTTRTRRLKNLRTKTIAFDYTQTAPFNSFSLYKNTPRGLPLLELMEEVLYHFINFTT